MALKLITAPTSEPVTTDEAKLWLRLDSDAEIDVVARLITTARQLLDGADGYLGRCIAEQTWALVLDRFPCERWVEIPLPPLLEIVSVKYLYSAGAEQTYASSNYRIDSDDWCGRILLNSGSFWPDTICERASVTITFKAGYANGAPEGLKNEILRLVGVWFDNREMAGQLPDGWSSQYRKIPVA
jgi:uncharacterized phiE125 gp8 family phage protein